MRPRPILLQCKGQKEGVAGLSSSDYHVQSPRLCTAQMYRLQRNSTLRSCASWSLCCPAPHMEWALPAGLTLSVGWG